MFLITRIDLYIYILHVRHVCTRYACTVMDFWANGGFGAD